MDGTASPYVSSTNRPLMLRMRPDLVTGQQSYQGRQYWVVKDPVSLNYYRFEEEEYALLSMLDGKTSIDEMKRRFDRQFAPQQITIAELHQFIGRLHRSSLVISESAGQGGELRERGKKTARRRRYAALSNILAVRFKGIDPDRFLGWLNRQAGWFFSLACVMFCLLMAGGALLLVGLHFDEFRSRLPGFHEFFAAKNWIWLAATLAFTKVLHEIGHGLACKRFGGECHEMGVMFLVLTPCLYCNVSDSWMLPSKWRRAAIGAAGMYVEIVLASLCTFLWWFSEPGMLNYLCLNVMFISSVSTLVFNANPLLRYDGYYILSDIMEVPNLRQKASTILRRKLGSWFLGLPQPHDPFLPHKKQWLFALYSVAAACYRWVVVLSILWFLNKVFEPYGFKIVGRLIACVVLYGLVVQPLLQLSKFFRVPGRVERVNKLRLLTATAAVAVAVFAVLSIPLPHYVTCSLHIQPRGATAVYVDVPGEIQGVHVRAGQTVEKNQPMLTLENVDFRLEVMQLESQLASEQAKLRDLEQRAVFGDETAAHSLAETEQAIATLTGQIERFRRQQQRLRISAPVAGTIVPPPNVPPEPDDSDRLSTWSGTPLEIRNVGAFVSDGTLVCHVGDPTQLDAVLAIDQTDIEFVREQQPVEIFLAQFPGKQLEGRLRRVSRMDMKYAPSMLSSKAGGDVVTVTDAAGRERPMNVTYQASVPLSDINGQILIGTRGTARIRVGSQTLGTRCWRYLCRTFNFEL